VYHKYRRFKRIISIFNNIDNEHEFTKDDFIGWLKQFYPTAKKTNLNYFIQVLSITKAAERRRDIKDHKTIYYKKLRNINKDDLSLAALEYNKKYYLKATKQILDIKSDLISKEDVDKLKLSTTIPLEQIQKVVETCLILTEEVKKLKKENEELKKISEEAKQLNAFNILIQKAEEATGISLK